jgi:ATP-dependent Clp protease, protease subunit
MTVIHMPKPKASGQYRMVNKSATRGEIWLYGVIGEDFFGAGVSAKQFAEDLKQLGNVATIDLHINSDGGVVTDARAMYNLLIQHKAKIITHIDGIAASAASFIAMAGDEIEIAEGGFVMIHNSRGVTIGDAEDHRRMAIVLDQVNQTIVNTYMARTGQDENKIKKWMLDETWFTGKDAVKNGFADRIVADMRVAASLSRPQMFSKLPSALLPKRATATATLAALRRRISNRAAGEQPRAAEPPRELRAGYDPNQQRDDEGKWSETGAGGGDSGGSSGNAPAWLDAEAANEFGISIQDQVDGVDGLAGDVRAAAETMAEHGDTLSDLADDEPDESDSPEYKDWEKRYAEATVKAASDLKTLRANVDKLANASKEMLAGIDTNMAEMAKMYK